MVSHQRSRAAPTRLRLYVALDTPGATRALESRSRLVEALNNEIEIEIVDVLSEPLAAEAAGILATPTLSDESVDPPRRLIGDLTELAQVLDFFGFRRRSGHDGRGD
jgi:circadian clock protein KaiB